MLTLNLDVDSEHFVRFIALKSPFRRQVIVCLFCEFRFWFFNIGCVLLPRAILCDIVDICWKYMFQTFIHVYVLSVFEQLSSSIRLKNWTVAMCNSQRNLRKLLRDAYMKTPKQWWCANIRRIMRKLWRNACLLGVLFLNINERSYPRVIST